MSIKNFDDLKLEGTICQFIDAKDLIEAVSVGEERVRCKLKRSAEYPGSYVVEVWAYDTDTQRYEAEGILRITPENPSDDLQLLRGNSYDKLRANMRLILSSDIYESMIIEELPGADPVSYQTEHKLELDLAGQVGGVLN